MKISSIVSFLDHLTYSAVVPTGLRHTMSRPNSNLPSRTQSFERNRRYIQSVSDIYGRDEVEELLDEIRHLEPGNFLSGDIQDFEIDGSRHLHHVGESTVSVSVQSWDSHAVYRNQRDNMNSPVEVIQAIVVQCRPRQCLEKLELFRLAFLVSVQPIYSDSVIS